MYNMIICIIIYYILGNQISKPDMYYIKNITIKIIKNP